MRRHFKIKKMPYSKKVILISTHNLVAKPLLSVKHLRLTH